MVKQPNGLSKILKKSRQELGILNILVPTMSPHTGLM